VHLRIHVVVFLLSPYACYRIDLQYGTLLLSSRSKCCWKVYLKQGIAIATGPPTAAYEGQSDYLFGLPLHFSEARGLTWLVITCYDAFLGVSKLERSKRSGKRKPFETPPV
jgi:hypothetical protein